MAVTPVSTDPNLNWFGFGEAKGSCDESYDFLEGNMTAQRIFIGPWANRADFIQAKIMANVAPGQDGNNQSVVPPNSYPDFPDAVAYKANVKGIFVAGQNANDQLQMVYDLAKITVDYKLFPFGWPGGGNTNVERAFIEEKVESTTELIPIPYSFTVVDSSPGYKVNNQVAPIKGHRDGKLNKTITIEHYKLMIPIVIEPNLALFDFHSGKVNSDVIILPSGYEVGIESFRYDGWSGVTKREISAGKLVWTIEHSFGHYWDGWNTLPAAALTDPDDPESDVVIINAAITPPLYDSSDLNQVLYGEDFQPEQ